MCFDLIHNSRHLWKCSLWKQVLEYWVFKCLNILFRESNAANLNTSERCNYFTLLLVKVNVAISEHYIGRGCLAIYKYYTWIGRCGCFANCRGGSVAVLELLLDKDSHCWQTESKNKRTPLHTAGKIDVTF